MAKSFKLVCNFTSLNMASNESRTYLMKLYFQRHLQLQIRTFAKLVKKQDPDEVKNMPIFQYATENTKQTKRVYMWGNAMFGALGHASFIKPVTHKFPLQSMNYPWRLPFADFHKVTIRIFRNILIFKDMFVVIL